MDIKFKILYIVIFLLLCACQGKQAQVRLSEYRYDFGEIQANRLYSGEATITNTGNDTLKILDVNGSCGCTQARVTKRELMPGDTCRLDFTYNTRGKRGEEQEYICLFANTDSVVHLLRIQAVVVP